MRPPSVAALGVLCLMHSAVPRQEPAALNDNRTPAGHLVGDTLHLAIDARETAWQPGGSSGRTIPLFAFAESGQRPSIPGPMVRVRAGTVVQVALRNRLDRPVTIHGLHDHDGATADSVMLAPGDSSAVSFRAVTPGTYMYWGRTPAPASMAGRYLDSQLVGALVVDSAAGGPRAHESVLVISAYDDSVKARGYPDDHFQVFAINGRSWPNTEPVTVVVGDTVHWRVINASDHFHPMHLHGFFFTVESRGTALADTIYTPAVRREAVTEPFVKMTTANLTWVASRPGHWLYHCHMIGHIETSLRARPGDRASMSHDRVEDVMSGLVVAVDVTERSGRTSGAAEANPARRIRLFVTERHGPAGSSFLSYVEQNGPNRPAADSMLRPSSTLILHQDEPTEITVTNLASQPTAVHWHGLELASFYDGVPGWSGDAARMARLIAPGDSFVVRLAPPRAGTFIYHTHSYEATQLRGGLFGAFIVLPPGVERRDTTERLLIIADEGLEPQEASDGTRAAGPIGLSAGVAHRLRIITIPSSPVYRIRLVGGSSLGTWRPIAKDGADLPAALSVERPAETVMGAGETFDVQVKYPRAETLTLELRKNGVEYYRVPVVVR